MIACNNLKIGYGSKEVLSGINFELSAGSLTVLVGANGSGKSTLLRTLAGNQSPISGNVTIAGKRIENIGVKELSKLRALVDTSKSGGGSLTVYETVAVGRHNYTGWSGRLSEPDKKMISDAIKSVGMENFMQRHIAELSDGERQKVMIARALAQETPVLMLDEPTSFLDVAARHEILSLLKKLAEKGKTILLSTHDIAPAMMNADYVLAVDLQRQTAILKPKKEMVESGLLDGIFASSGLHFDAEALDFRR